MFGNSIFTDYCFNQFLTFAVDLSQMRRGGVPTACERKVPPVDRNMDILNDKYDAGALFRIEQSGKQKYEI